jgi:hypothetical protein
MHALLVEEQGELLLLKGLVVGERVGRNVRRTCGQGQSG